MVSRNEFNICWKKTIVNIALMDDSLFYKLVYYICVTTGSKYITNTFIYSIIPQTFIRSKDMLYTKQSSYFIRNWKISILLFPQYILFQKKIYPLWCKSRLTARLFCACYCCIIFWYSQQVQNPINIGKGVLSVQATTGSLPYL